MCMFNDDDIFESTETGEEKCSGAPEDEEYDAETGRTTCRACGRSWSPDDEADTAQSRLPSGGAADAAGQAGENEAAAVAVPFVEHH